MGQFNTAKAVLSFLAVLGWIVAGLGIVAFFYLSSNIGFVRGLSALGIVAAGLIIVAVAQMGLAQIATAENTAAIYSLLLKKSGADHGQTVSVGAAYDSQRSKGLAKNIGDRVKSFKGYEILKADGGVSVDGKIYRNVLVAEQAINEKIENER